MILITKIKNKKYKYSWKSAYAMLSINFNSCLYLPTIEASLIHLSSSFAIPLNNTKKLSVWVKTPKQLPFLTSRHESTNCAPPIAIPHTVKNLNNWTVCYVVGLSSPSKVKKFLFFFRLGGGKGAVFLLCFSPPFQRREFWTS